MQNLYKDLEKILLSNDTFKSEDGKVLKNKVTESAVANDKTLIIQLLKNPQLKKHFFDEIEKGVVVFDREKFIRFINTKEFLPNSFTSFTNKIGLHNSQEYFNASDKVSLVWAYKDCVLEGGQDKEDQKRSEIFYNETLAPDEIDRLFEKKVLTNFKKYSKKGVEVPKEINDTDNLIIKGNNLLALHSLRKKYAGKVKLIYIDPPYNTGNDGFNYNDRFNHSTWLTFIKNRLEISKELLSEDGSIFISIDENEVGYLQVLCDEVFGTENRTALISVKRGSVTGHKAINPGVVNVTEYVISYAKNKKNWKPNKSFKQRPRNDRYNVYIKNVEKSVKNWQFISLLDAFSEYKQIPKSRLKKELGAVFEDEIFEFIKLNPKSVIQFAYPDFDKVSKETQKLILESQKNKDVVFHQERKEESDIYLVNGQRILFYEDRLVEIDGELVTGEPMSDFWDDVLPNDLHNEGGVTLKKGKKPEKLISRIVEIASNEGDIVLDFHLGSGTSSAVAHKMKRRYIGIEQMYYGENDAVARLTKVIEGDKSGVSRTYSWDGGGSFVYVELMSNNQFFVDEIESATTNKKLFSIYEKMRKEAFFRYEIDLSKFDVKEFSKLEIADQKLVLLECLDKNHLYVNYTDINDATYKVSPEDKKLNKLFYGE